VDPHPVGGWVGGCVKSRGDKRALADMRWNMCVCGGGGLCVCSGGGGVGVGIENVVLYVSTGEYERNHVALPGGEGRDCMYA
jgi:hypothetical protein